MRMWRDGVVTGRLDANDVSTVSSGIAGDDGDLRLRRQSGRSGPPFELRWIGRDIHGDGRKRDNGQQGREDDRSRHVFLLSMRAPKPEDGRLPQIARRSTHGDCAATMARPAHHTPIPDDRCKSVLTNQNDRATCERLRIVLSCLEWSFSFACPEPGSAEFPCARLEMVSWRS